MVSGTLVHFGYEFSFRRFVAYFCMGGINVNVHGLTPCLITYSLAFIKCSEFRMGGEGEGEGGLPVHTEVIMLFSDKGLRHHNHTRTTIFHSRFVGRNNAQISKTAIG